MADALRVLLPDFAYDLYRLVYPPDQSDSDAEFRGAEHWAWLGPHPLDALRKAPGRVAGKIAHLISETVRGEHPAERTIRGSRERLDAFLGAGADEVIRILVQASETAEGSIRALLNQVVEAVQVASPAAEEPPANP